MGENQDLKSFERQGQGCSTSYRCLLVTLGLFSIGALLSYRCPPSSTPIVAIEDGKIQGIISYSRNGTEYYSFFGIPYATAPLGKLRFSSPVPIQPWKDVKQVRSFKPDCKQFDAMIFHEVDGEEDCLNVNVFSPTKLNESRPVFVYIPGGGFMSGGASFYYPDYYMNHNILLITFNYRLGPFGFLNLESKEGDGSLPRGNMALKDQVLALKWVKRNAKYFGGDPERITVMGQSAGAVSLNFHLLSPQSRGLFHRAIIHSGSVFCTWGFNSNWKNISRNLIKRIGCPTDNRKNLLDCLHNYDADELIKHQISMLDPRAEIDLLTPSVESFRSNDAFLTESPLELTKKGNIAKVPLLIGMNGGEGAFRVSRFDAMPDVDLVSQYDSNWTQLVGKFLGFMNFPENLAHVVRERYFGNMSFTEEPKLFKHQISRMGSEAAMYEQAQRTAVYHAKTGAPTYAYFYNHRPIFVPGMYSMYSAVRRNEWLPPRVRVIQKMVIDWVDEFLLGNGGSHEYGVSHGEELTVLWNLDGTYRKISYWETEFTTAFIQTIVDFVNDKQPISYRGTEWTPINEAVENGEKLKYMLMDNDKGKGKMIPEPFTEAIEFWRGLGIENFN